MRRSLRKTTEYVHASTLFCVPYRLQCTLFNEFRACYKEFSGLIKEVGHMPISKPNSPNSLVWVNIFFAWRDTFMCIDSTLLCVPYRLRCTLFNKFRACYEEFSSFIKEVGHMLISKPNSPNSLVWVNVFFTWSDEFLCIDVKNSPQNRMRVNNAGTPQKPTGPQTTTR
jgi:hypothetical protein